MAPTTETSVPDYTSERIKHLEMIQSVVARMAATSDAMKRYCILAVAIGVAIVKTVSDPNIVAAMVIPIMIFWGLDARYLQQERWFRNLFDKVREESPSRRPDFRITPDGDLRASATFWGRVFSWSTLGLYLPLVLFVAIIWIVL